jgi:hypothetical protein
MVGLVCLGAIGTGVGVCMYRKKKAEAAKQKAEEEATAGKETER